MKKPRVTGLGGIFFKAKDAKKLQAWYEKHLELPPDPAWGGCSFNWRDTEDPKKKGATTWRAFEAGTNCFGRGRQTFMINYPVANLKRVLAQLKKEGAWVDPKTEVSEFGKFGWVKDAVGNRLELGEPPAQA